MEPEENDYRVFPLELGGFLHKPRQHSGTASFSLVGFDLALVQALLAAPLSLPLGLRAFAVCH